MNCRSNGTLQEQHGLDRLRRNRASCALMSVLLLSPPMTRNWSRSWKSVLTEDVGRCVTHETKRIIEANGDVGGERLSGL